MAARQSSSGWGPAPIKGRRASGHCGAHLRANGISACGKARARLREALRASQHKGAEGRARAGRPWRRGGLPGRLGAKGSWLAHGQGFAQCALTGAAMGQGVLLRGRTLRATERRWGQHARVCGRVRAQAIQVRHSRFRRRGAGGRPGSRLCAAAAPGVKHAVAGAERASLPGTAGKP